MSKWGKKGVVRDPSIHIEVITDLVSFFFFHQQGLAIRGLTYSPIKGPEGNREYLAILEKGGHSCYSIRDFIYCKVKPSKLYKKNFSMNIHLPIYSRMFRCILYIEVTEKCGKSVFYPI